MIVGRSFCAHAAERVRTCLESLSTGRDADERTIRTADAVLGWGAAADGTAR